MTQETTIAAKIQGGETYLGIEFGSTRIKAVLIDGDHAVLASGGHNWENRLEGGFWTYSMEAVFAGLQDAYAKLAVNVQKQYGVMLTRVAAMGISAMMHGYLAFDEKDNLLAPFRTWRNTTTGQAADALSHRFGFNIPQRWSIAHLYQAMLNREKHVDSVAFLTTLSGYIHYRLTGEKVIGIGDGSGMFPIDSTKLAYDGAMLKSFQQLVEEQGYGWSISSVLPKILPAGAAAGSLTPEGGQLSDPRGARAWSQPTPCASAPATSAPVPACLPCWCWNKRSRAIIPRWTW